MPFRRDRKHWPSRICRLIPEGFLACSMVALMGCHQEATGPSETSSDAAEIPTLSAEVLEVDSATWPFTVRTQGSLVADEVSAVGAKVAGRVADVHVDLGDVVHAGDPLVTLDQEDFRLQVMQAEAQLQQARAAVGLGSDDSVESLNRENAPPVRQQKALWDEAKAKLERANQLRPKNAISNSEFEQIQAAERVAEAAYASALNNVDEKIALIYVQSAELELAKQYLKEAVIRAPYDGHIQLRHVGPGAYVQVGNALVTMVRTNPLQFQGTMPERHAQQLAVGQKVRLKIESIPELVFVEVTRISPALNELSRALLFEAKVDNSDGRLRTGLFAEAEVVLDDKAQAIAVLASAVVEFAGAEKVWKVVDGITQEQIVETGQRRDGRIEITDGLSDGDVILKHGAEGLIAKITPITNSAESNSTLTKAEHVQNNADPESD